MTLMTGGHRRPACPSHRPFPRHLSSRLFVFPTRDTQRRCMVDSVSFSNAAKGSWIVFVVCVSFIVTARYPAGPPSWTPRNTLEDPYRRQVIDQSQSIASRTLTLPIIRHRPSVFRSSSPGPQHTGGSCPPACRVSVACRLSWTLTHFGPHLGAINLPVPVPVSLLG
ncbi:hypothetical protein GE21DRAFT_1072387 [Neurospora crassa]|nr:hypothetical protein GE21DRAFT_1072387 [Neurospora crassa]